MKRVVLAAALSLTLSIHPSAQTTKRVTVETTKGDVIEGVFRSATDSEIVIEVAGQPLRLPVDTIKYVSFTGRIAAMPPPTAPAASAAPAPGDSDLQAAIKGLRDVRGVVEVGGITRPQYAQKLGELLPRVFEYSRGTGADWQDARMAMGKAAETYQVPLKTDADWKNAASWLGKAIAWGDYAISMTQNSEFRTHVETPTDRPIHLNEKITGRLGNGDTPMPNQLDLSVAGGFNDVYRLDIDAPTRVEITMACVPCSAHLTVVDSTGKKLEGDLGLSGVSRIRRTLTPGSYSIWAGAPAREVGDFELMAEKK
jgi:hypothetical protein